MAKIRPPLEQHTRTQINLRLQNLRWNLNERDPSCNVTQGQARTDEQQKKLKGNFPDYILYDDSKIPIAVIEAKRPGQDLDVAMNQAVKLYAEPLNVPLAFAFNDTFVVAKYVSNSRPLKIDGEELQDFIDQITSLRFIHEGSEILSQPKGVNYTREELLDIFKSANKLLRKEGLRDGFERLSAFSEVLFLKLIDESERLNEHRNLPRKLDKKYCWSEFTKKKNGVLLDFISDTVWKQLGKTCGDIFKTPFSIKNPSTLAAAIELIDPINLTSTDTDVKGDAFEYFLKSVTNGNKDLGEYFTPRHIVRTMVHLIKPQFGEKIYDPFCGTGGFLLEAFKYLSLRVDSSKDDVMETLRTKILHGREITSTSRIAKMNMVLFGDGHSNIEQTDSLEHPVKGKYDIVLSNIPYSQETEYGSLYPLPSDNADSICMQHIWESLTPNGRAAVVVPESFLYEGGMIGKTREMIARQSKKLTIVSLPRGVFMPYTPTKTNIFYFQKDEKARFKNAFFFVIDNDGFELNTKRKQIAGESDLKKLLSNCDDPKQIDARANLVNRADIQKSEWNLRPFFYMEDLPDVQGETVYLKDALLEESADWVNPRSEPDKQWKILEVSQNGIFLGEMIAGYEFTQEYKIKNYQVVKAGDLVYNPYRINIGSIGVVPTHFEGGLVSPAYVVARAKADEFPPYYILSVLKSERYLKVIMHYSISSARASLPFSELIRIKIPKPTGEEMKKVKALEKSYNEAAETVNQKRAEITELATFRIRPEDKNPRHMEDFTKLLNRAAPKAT
jgi:type I restriction enzyme M protein